MELKVTPAVLTVALATVITIAALPKGAEAVSKWVAVPPRRKFAGNVDLFTFLLSSYVYLSICSSVYLLVYQLICLFISQLMNLINYLSL